MGAQRAEPGSLVRAGVSPFDVKCAGQSAEKRDGTRDVVGWCSAARSRGAAEKNWAGVQNLRLQLVALNGDVDQTLDLFTRGGAAGV